MGADCCASGMEDALRHHTGPVGVVPSAGFQTLNGILRMVTPDVRNLKNVDVLPKKQGR